MAYAGTASASGAGATRAPGASAGRSSFATFAIAAYVFSVVLPIGFDLGPLAMTTLRLLLLLTVIPLGVGLLSGNYGKIILTDYLFGAHVAWAAISLAVNNPASVVEQVGSIGIEFIGGYVLGRTMVRTREDFIFLAKLVVFSVAFLILPIALLENLTGRAFGLELIRSLPGIDSLSKVRPDPRMGFNRAQSLFAHAIHSGLFCSIAFSLCYVSLKSTLGLGQRLALSALLFVATLTSLSSGALLAIVLQLGLIIWHRALLSVERRWWILVGLAVFSYVVVDLLSNRTPLEVFMSYATFSAHNAYWRSIIFDWGLDNVIGNAERGIPPAPLFGIGLNSWIRPSFMHSGSMDNFWLVMALRYGLPGFFFLAIGYLFGLGKVIARDFRDDDTLASLRLGWVFTFIGLTFTLCTVHVWGNIYSFVFFFFGAGMWFITAETGSSGQETEARDAPPAPRGMRYTRFG